MANIQKVYLNYLKANLPADVKSMSLIENKDGDYPYGVVFDVDDPKTKMNLCVSDQGQTRFQVDVFDKRAPRGQESRDSLQASTEALTNTTIEGIYIASARITNVVSRPNTVDSMFQLSFECVLEWEK
jgi:hypothetical protein